MTLAAPEHQEMNGQVEVTWRTLRKIAHSLMVHARVLGAYIHFSFMYTKGYVFLVLPIKYLINEYGESTTTFKLATGTRPSVSYSRLFFCPYFVQKSTTHIDRKALNIRHQAQKAFSRIFVEIPEYQKGYLVYVPIIRKIISSNDVVFDKIFSSVLAHTSQPYSQDMDICLSVTYTPYATSSKEQTGNIVTFAQF